MTPLLTYTDAVAAGPAAVGGKAHTLARLSSYGLRVPDGLVVPTAEYRAHGAADSLPEAWRAALATALEAAGLADVPLAVRSSAIGEDGASHSFAGIHESHLHVRGAEAVCAAVRSCWASVSTPAALAYRERLGLDSAPACGVLICRMVGDDTPPPAAGVAFTADPLTGQRDLLVVEAAPGWADRLVQGEVAVERWRCDLRARPLAPTCAARREPGDVVLDADQTTTLAELARRVMWALGDGSAPQDIEWVFDGEAFWVVQARPVTRVPTWTFPGDAHLPRMWSCANVSDAVPGVLRPLSWCAAKTTIDHILYAPYAMSGYPLPAGLEISRRIDGRIMLDMTQLQWLCYDSLGMTPDQLELMIGGHQAQIPVPGPPYRGLVGLRRLGRAVRLLWRLRPHHARFVERCTELRATLRERATTDWRGLTDAALADTIDETIDETFAFGIPFVVAGVESGSLMLRELLDKHLGDQGPAVAAGLMAGTGDVVSAEQGFRIHDLGLAAKDSPAALAFLTTADPEADWQQLPENDPFRNAFAAFLSDFGHRCVYEAEAAHPRWFEDPTYLLDQVRRQTAAETGPSPRDLSGRARARAEEAVSGLPFFARLRARKLAKQARAGAARREAGKSTLATFIVPMRSLLAEAGRRFTDRGWLDAPEAVYDLVGYEVLAILRGDWNPTGAAALIQDRRAARTAWLALSSPEVVVLGPGDVPAEMPEDATAPATTATADGGGLRGIAAAPGVATGPACVVRHPDEGERLVRGGILVAPSTDPGWTPLFLRAAGIALENGGYLSHGSIVAREFGLPAVVNVRGLLDQTTDGAPLRVDGDRGVVAKP